MKITPKGSNVVPNERASAALEIGCGGTGDGQVTLVSPSRCT